MALDRAGCCDEQRKPCSYHEGVEDALDAQIAVAVDNPNLSPESRDAIEAVLRETYRLLVEASGEAGSGNAPTPATTGEAGTVLPSPAPSEAGAPPPPTESKVEELMDALVKSVDAAKEARKKHRIPTTASDRRKRMLAEYAADQEEHHD